MVEQDLLIDQLFWAQETIESCPSKLDLFTPFPSSDPVRCMILVQIGHRLPWDDLTVIIGLWLHKMPIFESNMLFDNIKTTDRKFVINDPAPEVVGLYSFLKSIQGDCGARIDRVSSIPRM